MPDGCRGPPAAPSQRPPHGRSGAGPDRSCALRTATRGCPAQQCGGGASQPRQPLLSNGDMPWAALMDRHTGPTAPAVAAASACCSLARNNTVGSSCPHIARTALGRGSRGAAWGRWPLLGCLTHGLRGGARRGQHVEPAALQLQARQQQDALPKVRAPARGQVALALRLQHARSSQGVSIIADVFFCIKKSGSHGIAPGAVRAGRAREASLCSPHGSAHPDLDSCHSTRAGPLRPRLLVSPSAPPPAAAPAA